MVCLQQQPQQCCEYKQLSQTENVSGKGLTLFLYSTLKSLIALLIGSSSLSMQLLKSNFKVFIFAIFTNIPAVTFPTKRTNESVCKSYFVQGLICLMAKYR